MKVCENHGEQAVVFRAGAGVAPQSAATPVGKGGSIHLPATQIRSTA